MHFSFIITSKLRWTPLSKFVFNFLYNVFTNLGNSHWTQTDPLEAKMIVLREIKISTLWNELPPVFHRQKVHLLDRTLYIHSTATRGNTKLNVQTFSPLGRLVLRIDWPKTFTIIIGPRPLVSSKKKLIYLLFHDVPVFPHNSAGCTLVAYLCTDWLTTPVSCDGILK